MTKDEVCALMYLQLGIREVSHFKRERADDWRRLRHTIAKGMGMDVPTYFHTDEYRDNPRIYDPLPDMDYYDKWVERHEQERTRGSNG